LLFWGGKNIFFFDILFGFLIFLQGQRT